MKRPPQTDLSRRRFLAGAAAGTAASLVVPRVITAQKTDSAVTVGEGEHQYAVNHHWAQLPADFSWQTTHDVTVDTDQNVYVIHEGHKDKPDHPSIFVFDADGKFVRAFGNQFQGGGHGLDIRNENGTEFLYVAAYQHLKTIAKLDLNGETVWQKYAPMESGFYAEGEATNPTREWGRNRFHPTNFAFLPDGDFLLADGYGAWCIHRYSKNGDWKSAFGGPGDGAGTFDTPHGIWLEARSGHEPRIVIADRAHHTLQFLSIDGEYEETVAGFGLPANIDTRGPLLLVPELYGRVTLLDHQNQVVAHLGDDSERIRADDKFKIRSAPTEWKPGRFVHPHDACFDDRGNIYVAEWMATGRITKLTKI